MGHKLKYKEVRLPVFLRGEYHGPHNETPDLAPGREQDSLHTKGRQDLVLVAPYSYKFFFKFPHQIFNINFISILNSVD